MSVVSRSSVRRALVAAVAVSAGLTLAGCVDAPDDSPTTGPTTRPSATATPDPTPAASEEAHPIDVECADLVDPDAVYAFDPNLALVGPFEPRSGTPAATDAAGDGVLCQWVRESGGGVTMDVSVGWYPEARLTQLKNEAFASSTMVPTYGDEAYFSVDGGVGTAIVFSGPYRLTVASQEFAEPGEPTDIIESALAALPAP